MGGFIIPKIGPKYYKENPNPLLYYEEKYPKCQKILR